MRISSQVQLTETVGTKGLPNKETVNEIAPEQSIKQIMQEEQSTHKQDTLSKEKLQKAVDALNEFMTTQNRSSKFVMHDGLNRYYVEVVDTDTDEVIREVPPRKLLDAFYTMQKFLGFIVDEKI